MMSIGTSIRKFAPGLPDEPAGSNFGVYRRPETGWREEYRSPTVRREEKQVTYSATLGAVSAYVYRALTREYLTKVRRNLEERAKAQPLLEFDLPDLKVGKRYLVGLKEATYLVRRTRNNELVFELLETLNE